MSSWVISSAALLWQLNSKKQTTQLKNGQRVWIDMFQKKHTDGQQAHAKMLNVTKLLVRNASQNHSEASLYTGQNSHQKIHKQQMLERVLRKGNPFTLLMGM